MHELMQHVFASTKEKNTDGFCTLVTVAIIIKNILGIPHLELRVH